MANVGTGRELEHCQVLKIDADAGVVMGSSPDVVYWPDYRSKRPQEMPIGGLYLTISSQPVGEESVGSVAIPGVVGGELLLDRGGTS